MAMKTFVTVVAAVFVAVHLSGCGPPGPTPGPSPPPPADLMNIVATAQANPDLSTLVTLLGKQDLVSVLEGPGPFTVFAPTDEAFEAIKTVTDELTDAELKNILKYHVHSGKSESSDLSVGDILDTLFANHGLTVASSGETVTIAGQKGVATVTAANVECTNGVVHIVSAVLIPTGVGVMTIVETAQATPNLSSLVTQLSGQADLFAILTGTGMFTVFAPTDDAFTAVETTVDTLSPEQLTDVLDYHVHTGKKDSSELTDGLSVDTLFASHDLTVANSGSIVTIEDESSNSARVTVADVECANGVVHIVDHVLIPTLAEIFIQT